MWSTAREIADGDLVILWATRDLIQPLKIERGKELNMRFGVYRHSDLIGVPYGSKVGSRNGRGFVHVLRPTPELWTLALPHRTQILYLADIAFVTSWLDIRPGSKVIEAGTGSGSFTHSTARTIGPTGHLWSYEFHETRYTKAREEFTQHGIDNIVTLTHRNVCKDGFTVVDTVDAVFLDLPAPWDAVPHAKLALRKDRTTRICCFSPCMEQVIRTVSALDDAGFTDVTMYETLLRPHQVDEIPPLPSIHTASAQLKEAAARREVKRLRQIEQARRAAKRKRGETGGGEDENDGEEDGGEKGLPVQETEQGEGIGKGKGKNQGKRAKTEESEDVETDVLMSVVSVSDAATPLPAGSAAIPAVTYEEPRLEPPSARMSISKAFPDVRGHTSYLTFAVLLPAAARELAARQLHERLQEAQSGASSAVGTPRAES